MVSPSGRVGQNGKRRESSARVLEEAREFDVDLVQVDVHSGPCLKCLRVQGKVFSVSGKTAGFPRLTDEVIPPICDACRHVLVGVDPDFLDARGQTRYLQVFSCDPDRVVADVLDYQAVLSGKSPGRPWAEGARMAEEFRQSHRERGEGGDAALPGPGAMIGVGGLGRCLSVWPCGSVSCLSGGCEREWENRFGAARPGAERGASEGACAGNRGREGRREGAGGREAHGATSTGGAHYPRAPQR
jgi:hypothetical protein